MKKTITICISVLMLCLSLTACGKSLNGKSFSYEANSMETYYLEFTKDSVIVEHNVYKLSNLSPSGKMKDSSKSSSETYDYKIVEKGVIECNGKEYTYDNREIVKLTSLSTSDKYDGLVFDAEFLGISKEWREM